ncbi:MAG: HAMP domain-containing sensor histidine kinase [Mastigocoleus sp. MO_167.B18]|nr:HAMP domain-containing sensor histidine kinase [Mastigocoleus sp. MO_167.B18]
MQSPIFLKGNKLFIQTRWRLASWYAGVMGFILTLCGWGVYEAIAHAHWVTLQRELNSVSATIHNSLEFVLEKPGYLTIEQVRFLPSICLVGDSSCSNQKNKSHHTLANVIQQDDYYIRLVDISGKTLALAGEFPQKLPLTTPQVKWHTFQLRESNNLGKDSKRYHQITLLLHTRDNRDWGYLQVGRSIKDFDSYLGAIRLIMFVGLPLAMLLVGIASWWLAKLAMQPLCQSYQQIQQFTSDAAHELRTPLAATRATVESVLRLSNISEQEARENLEVVKRQNYRLSQLVDSLLLLSRFDQQGIPKQNNLQLEQVCLNDLVNDVAEELAPLAVAANIELKTDIRINQALEIPAREEQLYRMLTNLVTNAINYTPEGGKVKIILDITSSQALIKVQDTGIGIATEKQKQIFERFYRVDSDRSRKSGGFGLGLPIAVAIARVHQGNIELNSELDQGSTFTVRLPIKKFNYMLS